MKALREKLTLSMVSLFFLISKILRKLLKKTPKSWSLDIVYQVCSNESPWVKIDPVQGVIAFPYMYIVKTYKLFFQKPK
jgi:hypothetical protein